MKRLNRLTRWAAFPALLSAALLAPSILADSGAAHRVRNLHFGVSGGNVRDISRRFCCSGTLGALVAAGGTQYVLSNNHVLGLSGQANPGDDVSQPGLIDNNCRVSTVVADFTTAPPLGSNVDAAIAQLRAGLMDSTGFIEDIGTISSVVGTPSVGLGVAKSGRTTGFTTGTITSVSTSVSVQYPKKCGSGGGTIISYTNQVVIGNQPSFSAGGDSGSLIVTNDACNQPVALLFAGSSTSTIGNPASDVISQVSAALGSSVSFVGDNCSASTAALEPLALGRTQQPVLSDDAVEYAGEIMRRHVGNLMSRAGIIGVGIGASDLDPTQPVIVVYIDRTATSRASVPNRLNGVRVKRVFTDPFVAF